MRIAVSFASVPAIREEGLRRLLAGEQLAQRLGQLDQRLCREQRGDVLQRLDLLLDRGDHARLAVAEADGDDAAEEVEVLLAVGIEQPLTLAANERQRLLVVAREPVEILAVLGDDLSLVQGCTRAP